MKLRELFPLVPGETILCQYEWGPIFEYVVSEDCKELNSRDGKHWQPVESSFQNAYSRPKPESKFLFGEWAYAEDPKTKVNIVTTELDCEHAPVVSQRPGHANVFFHRKDGTSCPANQGYKLVPLVGERKPREIFKLEFEDGRLSLASYTKEQVGDMLSRDKTLKYVKFVEDRDEDS